MVGRQVLITCFGGIGTVALDLQDADTAVSVIERVQVMSGAEAPLMQNLWVEHNGRRWPKDVAAVVQGILPGCKLYLRSKLLGGGGDGGSTGAESRSSYLEMYQDKKPDKVNPAEELLARWTTCRLSGLPLTPPCCVDELGYIFNKDAVIQALMDKSIPKALAHISSLKHITDVQLSRASLGNGARRSVATARNYQPGNDAEFACPITGLEMNGKYRFVVLQRSGHVVSEKALKQCPAAVEEHIGYKFDKADVLPINGSPEEVAALRDALLEKRTAAKAKKGKKKGLQTIANGLPHQSLTATPNDGAGTDLATESTSQAGVLGQPVERGSSGAKRGCEVLTISEKARAKRQKEALAMAPEGASKEVWASLFNSSTVEHAETYACRGNYGGLR